MSTFNYEAFLRTTLMFLLARKVVIRCGVSWGTMVNLSLLVKMIHRIFCVGWGLRKIILGLLADILMRNSTRKKKWVEYQGRNVGCSPSEKY